MLILQILVVICRIYYAWACWHNKTKLSRRLLRLKMVQVVVVVKVMVMAGQKTEPR